MAILEFEKPIVEIQKKIKELKEVSESSGMDISEQIKTFEEQALEYKKDVYSNLSPEQRIQIARHADRPTFLDYVELMTTDFMEMHGDREGTDDRSIIGGIAKISDQSVVIIGTQKGKNTKENLTYNFGMPQPQGYRKALRLFYHANKFKLPIVTLIDTPGAYPGIRAEETAQGRAIAVNLCEMAKLNVPIISVITGEGCSGGALGLAVADRVYMLEHAYYTVISPEGCASILYRDSSKAAIAAEALKITSEDLLRLDVIDGIIIEPLGGAHNDYNKIANDLKNTIIDSINELETINSNILKEERYEKFRKMGVFFK